MPAARFLAFNVLGAAIWAVLVTGVGYVFGQSLHWLMADLVKYEEAGVLAIIGVAVLITVVHRLLAGRR